MHLGNSIDRLSKGCVVYLALMIVLQFSAVSNLAQSRDAKGGIASMPISSTPDRVANEMVLESDALTVRHITINPGYTGYHYKHPGGSIILLRDYSYRIAIPLNGELESELKVGDVMRIDPGDYVLANPGSKPLEFLSIEMKHAAPTAKAGDGATTFNLPAGLCWINNVR